MNADWRDLRDWFSRDFAYVVVCGTMIAIIVGLFVSRLYYGIPPYRGMPPRQVQIIQTPAEPAQRADEQ
jgi:hypothetical protein